MTAGKFITNGTSFWVLLFGRTGADVDSAGLCTSASCSLTAGKPQQVVTAFRMVWEHFVFTRRNLPFTLEVRFSNENLELKREAVGGVVVAWEAEMVAVESRSTSDTMIEP